MNGKEQGFSPYKVIYRPGTGEIVEKKSRFIADAAPVKSEEEAAAFIEAVRKKYYDARHHCSAFVIGKNRELTRCSDDGEPSGTAGKPILEVLNGEGLTDSVIVVTRYFGGTLLGTGGLARAYTEAAKEALRHAETAVMRYGELLGIAADYTDLGKIQYLLGNKGIPIQESVYTDKVQLTVRVPEEESALFLKELTECTCARAAVTVLEKGYYMESCD